MSGSIVRRKRDIEMINESGKWKWHVGKWNGNVRWERKGRKKKRERGRDRDQYKKSKN